MAVHWSSRVFLWTTGTFLVGANLENFGIFSVSLKDGLDKPLWITKAPNKVHRHTWVYY